MKKKPFDLKKFILWGSIPAAIIAIGTFIIASSKTITVYADLPEQVEQTKNEVVDIKEYIKEQKMANDLMQKIVTKQEENIPQVNQNDPIISPDGKYQWSYDLQKWFKRND